MNIPYTHAEAHHETNLLLQTPQKVRQTLMLIKEDPFYKAVLAKTKEWERRKNNQNNLLKSL